MSEGRWLSGRKAISNYLNVTGRTVSRLADRYSDFPVSFFGRKMMAKTEDLDAWVKKHAATPCEKCGGMVVV